MNIYSTVCGAYGPYRTLGNQEKPPICQKKAAKWEWPCTNDN